MALPRTRIFHYRSALHCHHHSCPRGAMSCATNERFAELSFLDLCSRPFFLKACSSQSTCHCNHCRYRSHFSACAGHQALSSTFFGSSCKFEPVWPGSSNGFGSAKSQSRVTLVLFSVVDFSATRLSSVEPCKRYLLLHFPNHRIKVTRFLLAKRVLNTRLTAHCW